LVAKRISSLPGRYGTSQQPYIRETRRGIGRWSNFESLNKSQKSEGTGSDARQGQNVLNMSKDISL
jgi:hypothetical protein